LTEQEQIRVVVIEPWAFVRIGLCSLLEETPTTELVAAVEDGHGGLAYMQQAQPSVAVMAVQVAERNQFALMKQMLRISPQPHILILASEQQKSLVARAVAHGASSYLYYEASTEALVEAITKTARGTPYYGASSNASQRDLSFVTLPARQLEVLSLLSQGMPTKEIAERLALSVKTVDSHRSRMMKKVGVHTTDALIAYALQHGLITEARS